ncbi:hypothetical protein BGZ95_000651 [Linnemannia exigua]|uniref:Uncharacterized protein n=1 Tax=Linnemannia exigua TaxID=604196 RepID=A0AAD4DKV5_9FUNG|nr:hypothetical protein BGZ95_000651 [Linnemannia exigua]
MLSTVSLIDPTTLNPSFSGPDTSRMGRPAVIITRADQQTAVDQLQLLLTNAKAYRLQMLGLSKAAASFGYALEKIAHSKASVRDPSSSDTLYKQFEIPLLQHLDSHKANIEASEAQYERSMRDMSQKIKETEATSLQNGRKRQRGKYHLLQFRQALTTLTMQVDELERIKLGYYFGNLESEQANLQLILQKTSTIVRAEVDIYERIANKGLNDTILEPMTTQGPDPYCTYATTDEFSSIFSILPATPIIPTAAGGTGSTGTSTPQPDPIMTTFYGYHEANPFSTARNQTGTRDRHLFGEASSVESKESMMDKAATVVVTATAGGANAAGAKSPAANAATTVMTTTSTSKTVVTETKDVASTSTSGAAAAAQDSTYASPDQVSTTTTLPSKPFQKVSPSDKTVQALAIVEEEKSTVGTKTSSELDTNSEVATLSSTDLTSGGGNSREAESGTKNHGTEISSSANQNNGVNMRRGQQHHRNRTFSKQLEDNASSAASAPSTSDQASSIPSYTHRSRSGSRSHLLLASTPDSPPVRGMIHIAGDSELLNNKDFSFSYEPSELFGQRSGGAHHHHQYDRSPFDGMMEEDEGGFGTSVTSSNGRARPSLSNHHRATGGSSSAASSLGGSGSGGLMPLRSNSGGNVGTSVAGTGHLLHGLRHTSSDGQLSHSSSSNLSSLGSTHSYSTGSLHHRRSTGRIKTSSNADQYLTGSHHMDDGASSSGAMALETSLDDPTSSSFMSWRKASSAGLMTLGGAAAEPFGGRGGFEDGMPAFFADDDTEDRLDQSSTFSGARRSITGRGSRPESGSDQDATTNAGAPGQQDSNDTDSSIIQMADGSSKNVSSTHVHEIVV